MDHLIYITQTLKKMSAFNREVNLKLDLKRLPVLYQTKTLDEDAVHHARCSKYILNKHLRFREKNVETWWKQIIK